VIFPLTSSREGRAMLDILYLVIGAAAFAVTALYLSGCDSL
jgi:hypothetical protein